MRRRRRKPKKGNLFAGIAILISFPFLMNLSKTNSFLNSLVEMAVKFIIICVVGFIVYWFFSANKRKAEHLQARKFVSLKPITSDKSNQRKPETWSKELINSLEWKRFEELCAEYFNEKGYKAKVTRQGADGGIDIHLFKNGYSLTKASAIVQCKAWNSYKVGVKPVRELYGVMSAEQVSSGIFITSGSYTKEAVEFSKRKRLKSKLELIDGDLLLERIQGLSEEQQQTLLGKITAGDYLTPSCPSCGIKMTEKTSKKRGNISNKFWGCVNFPKCRCTLHIKAKA